jgi:hypothetical protein
MCSDLSDLFITEVSPRRRSIFGADGNEVLLEALKKLAPDQREALLLILKETTSKKASTPKKRAAVRSKGIPQGKAIAPRKADPRLFLWRVLRGQIPESDPQLPRVLDSIRVLLVDRARRWSLHYDLFPFRFGYIRDIDETMVSSLLLSEDQDYFGPLSSTLFRLKCWHIPSCQAPELFGLAVLVALIRNGLETRKQFAELVLTILVELVVMLTAVVEIRLRWSDAPRFLKTLLLIEHQFFEQHGLGRPPRALC